MRLSELLAGMSLRATRGSVAIDVSGRVRDDSRLVEPGDVFVALRGAREDGLAHIEMAERRGAAAVVADREAPSARTFVLVADARRALAQLAAAMHGHPADALVLAAVTGTNGKTTTTWLLHAMLRAAGWRSGVIGTVGYRVGGVDEGAPLTTPGALELHRLLQRHRDAGGTHVVLEASSHALSMHRLAGISLAVAAFSNLTRDHLDFHRTMEAYCAAKRLLFEEHLRPDGVAVVNVDAEGAEAMIAAAGDRRLLRCSARGRGDAEVAVLRAESTLRGTRAFVATPLGTIEIRSALAGAFNLDNLLLATGMACGLGLPAGAIADGAAELSGVPGRLELVFAEAGVTSFVDYAHTPDALERALAALRALEPRRLLLVFGCGGDRDRTKRPLMGAIAARGADQCVITSDNPRTERPEAILEEILEGVPVAEREHCVVIPDRREALRHVVGAAAPGDVLLVAGKGHETSQAIGRTKQPFDDREELRRAWRQRPPSQTRGLPEELDHHAS